MQLRPYQLEALDAIWAEIMHSQTALCVLPTGAGKTEVFIGFIKKCMEIMPGFRAAVLMGRIDLVAQTDRRFRAALEPRNVGVYCGSLNRKEMNRPITIASIHSADAKRFPMMNLIVVDEVHRLDEKNGAYIDFIEKQQDLNRKLKIVGFTATPFRATGEIFGENNLFKRVCYRKSIKDMIAIDHLCEPKMKSSKHEFDISNLKIRAGEYRQEDVNELVSNAEMVRSQVTDALARMMGKHAIVWACANIEHCNMVADILMSLGEMCTTVHSKLKKDNRTQNLAQFIGGAMRHMSFVSILSEGFDHPPIDCVVLMRPTRSPVLYVQTVGRGLRPYPGKEDCLVLDYGQVIRTLGPLDDPKVKGKKGDGDAVLKLCASCYAWVSGGFSTCPECDTPFPPPKTVYEKLDKKADHEVSILSKIDEPEKKELGPAIIGMHQAKSGNQCVRITYLDKNLASRFRGVTEYFVTTSPWAVQRLDRRLEDIGAPMLNLPLEEEIEIRGTFEIVKKKDGKYDRILSVKKISEDTPSSARQDDEMSFNFGSAGSMDDINF